MNNDLQDVLKQFERHSKNFDKNTRVITCKGAGNNVDDKLIESAISYMIIRDYEKSIPIFENAANQGHMGAQYILGEFYEDGKGVNRSLSRAAYWYRKAATQGHAYAQNNLGTLYYNGFGFAKNKVLAMYWHKKAAKQGHEAAERNLNRLEYGVGKTIGIIIVIIILIFVFILNIE